MGRGSLCQSPLQATPLPSSQLPPAEERSSASCSVGETEAQRGYVAFQAQPAGFELSLERWERCGLLEQGRAAWWLGSHLGMAWGCAVPGRRFHTLRARRRSGWAPGWLGGRMDGGAARGLPSVCGSGGARRPTRAEARPRGLGRLVSAGSRFGGEIKYLYLTRGEGSWILAALPAQIPPRALGGVVGSLQEEVPGRKTSRPEGVRRSLKGGQRGLRTEDSQQGAGETGLTG